MTDDRTGDRSGGAPVPRDRGDSWDLLALLPVEQQALRVRDGLCSVRLTDPALHADPDGAGVEPGSAGRARIGQRPFRSR